MKTLVLNDDPALEAAEIRPVPKIFERERSYHHELEWKDGPWAIYRYRFINSKKPKPHWRYEAVILRITEPHPRSEDKRLIEALPSNSDWGRFGWSFNTLEKAQEQIANERISRGDVIESNYYSHFKKGVENFRKGLAKSADGTLSPSENIETRYQSPVNQIH